MKIIKALLLVALVGVIGSAQARYQASAQGSQTVRTAGVKHVSSEAELNQHLASASGTTILFLHRPSCPHCKEVWPVFNSLAAQHAGRAHFVAIDIENPTNAHLMDKYIGFAPFQLPATPYFVAFKNGQPVEGSLPGIPKDQLGSFVRKHVA